MHDVKAVLFDAGNTLLRVHPSVGEIYAGVARTYGIAVDPEIVELRFREVFTERDGDLCDYTSPEQERLWWRQVVETVFERAGLLDDFGTRFDAYFDELNALFAEETVWRVFDDAPPALDRIRALGLRCAVASNWDSRLPALLETMRLRRYFEFVLTSAEVGRAKPHPLLLEASLARLNLAPREVLYVGDSYEHDVVGARNADMPVVLIDRRKKSRADVDVIHSLEELGQWLTTRASSD